VEGRLGSRSRATQCRSCDAQDVRAHVLAQSKIDLLINPTDADHRLLHETIETAISRLRAEESLESETQSDIRNITRLGQAILGRAWQRVKIGT